MAAEAFGLESITAGEIPVDVFVFILFVVTIGILEETSSTYSS